MTWSRKTPLWNALLTIPTRMQVLWSDLFLEEFFAWRWRWLCFFLHIVLDTRKSVRVLEQSQYCDFWMISPRGSRWQLSRCKLAKESENQFATCVRKEQTLNRREFSLLLIGADAHPNVPWSTSEPVRTWGWGELWARPGWSQGPGPGYLVEQVLLLANYYWVGNYYYSQ